MKRLTLQSCKYECNNDRNAVGLPITLTFLSHSNEIWSQYDGKKDNKHFVERSDRTRAGEVE